MGRTTYCKGQTYFKGHWDRPQTWEYTKNLLELEVSESTLREVLVVNILPQDVEDFFK